MSKDDERITRRMVSLAIEPYLKSDRKLRRLHYRATLSIIEEEREKIAQAVNDIREKMEAWK